MPEVYPDDASNQRLAEVFDPSDTSPAARLVRALADAGSAIEDMEPHHRKEAVHRFLEATGWFDAPGHIQQTFLCGVFTGAHWLRLSTEGLNETLEAAARDKERVKTLEAQLAGLLGADRWDASSLSD